MPMTFTSSAPIVSGYWKHMIDQTPKDYFDIVSKLIFLSGIYRSPQWQNINSQATDTGL